MTPWIGVDLDGTLAEYHEWQGVEHIGRPIPRMVERVKQWLEEGKEVRIFTARVAENPFNPREPEIVTGIIQLWCLEHLGKILPVTNKKDFGMMELWDDRCKQVVSNTGMTVREATLGYD